MKKVLFVCLGNICRSPMAEGLLRDLAGDTFVVDSAATSRYQIGEPPHPGTQAVLKSLGISTQGMRARQITQDDFINFDYIIGMDEQNIIDLKAIAPAESLAKIHLCIEGVNVPDPYYTHDFEETKRLLLAATQTWFDRIQKNSAV